MTGVRLLRENGLGLAFGGLFLATLAGQALAGVAALNDERVAEGLQQVALLRYVSSSSFGVAVMENWQSEYLQFFLYVFATVWFVQRGSAESKEPRQIGPESDRDQLVGAHAHEDSPAWVRAGGWRTAVYSRSLGLLVGALFLATWAASSVAGWAEFNNRQLMSLADPVSWAAYVGKAAFWERTFRNGQSEMLAVGSFVVFTVYLRQRGSPESKPVGTAHADTGDTG